VDSPHLRRRSGSDYYEPDVTWHSAIDASRSIEALLREVGSLATAAPDLADDLQTLASVLRIAADRGVDFSLMLRLSAKDSMQVVRTREVRQGSFW
jgi:hypothetical protein